MFLDASLARQTPGDVLADAVRPVVLAARESRPIVQLIFGVRFLAGLTVAALTTGRVPEPAHAVLAAVAAISASFAVYLVNGIADVVEDRANHSTRPIASGRLDEGTAKVIAVAATALALGCASHVSLPVLGCVAVVLAVGCAYSAGPFPLKNTVPTFLGAVFVLGAGTYAAGALAVGPVSVPALVLAGAMSAWMGFAGASKDLADVTGDRAAGRRTWPVRLGEHRARRRTAVGSLAVAACFCTGALAVAPLLVLPALVLVAGALRLATVLLRRRDDARAPYRTFMATQYAVHLALAVSVGLAAAS